MSDCWNTIYYIPYQAVLRPDITTTKLGVVYGASCRTSSGILLNDALMVEPVVQNDLISTIFRFCQHRIALIADVAKIYRMFRVPEKDQQRKSTSFGETRRRNQRIRLNCSRSPMALRVLRKYLATRCLIKLGEDSGSMQPNAAWVVQEHS